MLGRGSPKFNLMQTGNKQKKLSPRCGPIHKKRASPKVAQKVDHRRASWNMGLEKGLVELLHYHNNDCYRSQNGWSTEAWNRIVKLFHEKFPYVSFTKMQIQDKEKELKRDFNLLKEAKKQSGAHWDETLGMIHADPPVWDNIITSFPKARKFQTKPFPLFQTLWELYEGHTADGALNFTSTEPVPTPRVTQLLPHEDVTQLISDSEALEEDGHNYAPRVEEQLPHEEEDNDVRVLEPPQGPRCAGTTSSRPTTSRRATELIPQNGGRKVGKRQKQEHVTAKMEKYLELRTQQVEEEVAAKARAASEVDDFSIKNCISYVNTIEELSGEEKAEAFDVFKDAQNRQIFMTAEPVSRLIWLRKEMRKTTSQVV